MVDLENLESKYSDMVGDLFKNFDEFSNELKLCRKNPHKYICDWMEGNLLYVGSKVFRVLALQPCSLVLPNVDSNSTGLRSSFNVLLIAPPSSGKSTICKKYEEFTINPYAVRKVSAFQLSTDLSSLEMFTLILEDFSQIGNDYGVVKVIEGAVGDEQKVSWVTQKSNINKNVRGVGLLCGTWHDLGKYLDYFRSGLLFRFFLLFVNLTNEEKTNIGKFINDSVGNKRKSVDSLKKEVVVKVYYDELYKIMANESKEKGVFNHKIEQINGYSLRSDLKNELYEEWLQWNNKVDSIDNLKDHSLSRELQEGYRFAISSCLLNIFNRKVEGGVMYPNEEDFILAKSLMVENIKNKIAILQSQFYLKNIRNLSDLQNVLQQRRVPGTIKKILVNLYKYSKGK